MVVFSFRLLDSRIFLLYRSDVSSHPCYRLSSFCCLFMFFEFSFRVYQWRFHHTLCSNCPNYSGQIWLLLEPSVIGVGSAHPGVSMPELCGIESVMRKQWIQKCFHFYPECIEWVFRTAAAAAAATAVARRSSFITSSSLSADLIDVVLDPWLTRLKSSNLCQIGRRGKEVG